MWDVFEMWFTPVWCFLANSPSLSVFAVLCFMTRMEILHMNSTKRRWWRKTAERSPNWSGFRKTLFHRWERLCNILHCWLSKKQTNRETPSGSPITVLPLSYFQGIVKLDHPCIHVDFPIILCEVWYFARDRSPLQCSHIDVCLTVVFQSQNFRAAAPGLETRGKTVV